MVCLFLPSWRKTQCFRWTVFPMPQSPLQSRWSTYKCINYRGFTWCVIYVWRASAFLISWQFLSTKRGHDKTEMYVSQQRNMYSSPAAFGYAGNHTGYNIGTPDQSIQNTQSCYYNSSARYNFNNYARTQSFPNSCSYPSLPSVPNVARGPAQNCNMNIYSEPIQSNFPNRSTLPTEALLHIPRHPARDLLPDLDDKPISPISGGKFLNTLTILSQKYSLFQ